MAISIGIAAGIGFGRSMAGSSLAKSLVASYRCYDKTNDDEDRDVLKDLTGNGHDIQLYNFAFSGESGYGKYNCHLSNAYEGTRYEGVVTEYKAHITKLLLLENRNYIDVMNITNNFKVSISGVTNDNMVRLGPPGENTYLLSNGMHEIDISRLSSLSGISFGINGDNTDVDITIELIPDYQGALVSDGVDDYGLCENFPVFTKDRGYTVCAIREWINNKGTLVSKRTIKTDIPMGDNVGAFQVERAYGETPSAFSFGVKTNITVNQSKFIYQNKESYCGNKIKSGIYDDNMDLTLFSYYSYYSVGSFALYALEIYDRDLTDDEIAKVKSRMIAEYESKTGNKYEEETI